KGAGQGRGARAAGGAGAPAARAQRGERTCIGVVHHSVAVQIGPMSAVAARRAIGREIVALVQRVDAAVLVEVAVARIPIAVQVGIALVGVGNLGAVVAPVDAAVAVGIAARRGAVRARQYAGAGESRRSGRAAGRRRDQPREEVGGVVGVV